MQPFVSAGVFFSELSLLKKSTPIAEIYKLSNYITVYCFLHGQNTSVWKTIYFSATKHHQVQFRAVCQNKTASISDYSVYFLNSINIINIINIVYYITYLLCNHSNADLFRCENNMLFSPV